MSLRFTSFFSSSSSSSSSFSLPIKVNTKFYFKKLSELFELSWNSTSSSESSSLFSSILKMSGISSLFFKSLNSIFVYLRIISPLSVSKSLIEIRTRSPYLIQTLFYCYLFTPNYSYLHSSSDKSNSLLHISLHAFDSWASKHLWNKCIILTLLLECERSSHSSVMVLCLLSGLTTFSCSSWHIYYTYK